MGRSIIVTEAQFNALMQQQMLCEGLLSGCTSLADISSRLVSVVKRGLVAGAVALALVSTFSTLTPEQKEELKMEIAEAAPMEQWREVANDVIATVYNAQPAQCNNDVQHTASMFKLNLNDVASHRIIAMERTFMAELGLKYGDIVKVEGTYKGLQDGVYQVQDTMNKRFAGQHKIDILVPNNIKYGGTAKGTTCKIFVLNNPQADKATFKADMAPSLNNIEKKQDKA